MKRTAAALSILVFLSLLPAHARNADEDDGGVAMELVVRAIKEALKAAETVEVPRFDLELTGVTVQLKTVVTRKKGGEINFWIFAFGRSKTQEASSTITVELSAPRPGTRVRSLDQESFTHALTAAIVEAKKSYAAASEIDPKLTQGKATLEFKFAVSTENKGSVELPKIIPIGIELGGSRSASHVHTITLKFTERGGEGRID